MKNLPAWCQHSLNNFNLYDESSKNYILIIAQVGF
jgi:hypothetical protein